MPPPFHPGKSSVRPYRQREAVRMSANAPFQIKRAHREFCPEIFRMSSFPEAGRSKTRLPPSGEWS